jgi:hypothetical protein
MSRAVNRRLFNLVALLSALLFAWACWAWVRSYQPRHLALETSRGRLYLMFWEGGSRPLAVEFWPGSTFAARAHELFREVINPSPQGQAREWLGFGYAEGRTPSIPTIRIVAIPMWFIAGLTGTVPVAWIVRGARQRRRARENRCVRCGYDLRASAGRCPECGTAVQVREPASASA